MDAGLPPKPGRRRRGGRRAVARSGLALAAGVVAVAVTVGLAVPARAQTGAETQARAPAEPTAPNPAPARASSPSPGSSASSASSVSSPSTTSTTSTATPPASAAPPPASAQAAPPAPARTAGPAASADPPLLTLDGLPRPAAPPAETGPVVPAQVERWRLEAKALEYGDGGRPRDAVRAAELYCRAARHGDPEAQYNLAWMLTNSRGIERDEAQAAHLFAAAAEQGIAQAQNILARMGAPRGAPPACLRPPEDDVLLALPTPASAPRAAAGRLQTLAASRLPAPPPLPKHAPAAIVRFVQLVAPEYQLDPHLVLAFIATESNFDPLAVSPKNAQGLMQLIPGTAQRFGVRNVFDPVQNIRGGMAYLRWLMATFQGDIRLVAAAYNAGEGNVERYLGVPPFAETRMYVYKIVKATGGQVEHRFDPKVAPPSRSLSLMNPTGRR